MNEAERQSADERWEQRFSELEKYISILGHARISRGDFANTGLRTWLRTQQQMTVAGTLSTGRWWRLTGLGLTLLGNDERWQMRFVQMRQFKERFGHCRIPAKWKENVPLGHWVHVQREFRKKGILSAMRIALLESVGFEWHARWPHSRDMSWDEMLGHLEHFRREHGHTEVPRGYRLVPRLSGWMQDQREAHRNGTLRADRRERLEAAGFVWKATGRSWQQLWDERFAQLLAYRERFGHTRVPAKWKEDVPFGHWVHVQREFKKKGMLSPERIQRLDAIGFQWFSRWPGSHHMRWDEMLGHLEQFRCEHGHTEVPRGYGRVARLPRWVGAQREAHRNGTLRADRRERLEALGFVWKDTRRSWQQLWDLRFAQLLAYRARFGHCRVPAKWKEDVPFGHWVHVQREFKKKSMLSPERIRRLDDIGFQWGK